FRQGPSRSATTSRLQRAASSHKGRGGFWWTLFGLQEQAMDVAIRSIERMNWAALDTKCETFRRCPAWIFPAMPIVQRLMIGPGGQVVRRGSRIHPEMDGRLAAAHSRFECRAVICSSS